MGKGAGGEEAGDLRGASFREQHGEVVEAIGDVVGDALEPGFVPEHGAVVEAGKIVEDGADAAGISAGDHAEIPRAAPDRLARAEDMVVHGAPDQLETDVRFGAGVTMADPAIEEGGADGDEPARSRVGHFLENVPDKDAAHAVADDVNHLALRFADEVPELEHIFLEASPHGGIPELARLVTELAQAATEQRHLPAVDHRAMDKNDGGRGGGSPFRIHPGGGHGEN